MPGSRAKCCRSTTSSVCFHDNGDGCDCRKPRPGMLLDAAPPTGTSISRAATWSATAGATSRRATPPAAGPFFIDYGYRRAAAQRTVPTASLRYAKRSDQIIRERGTKHEDESKTLKVKIFADGADKAGMLEMYAKPYHQGPDDQSDADAQGRDHRLRGLLPRTSCTQSRTGRSRSRCSPTTSPRWSARRWRSRAGASNVYVKIPGDQHASAKPATR